MRPPSQVETFHPSRTRAALTFGPRTPTRFVECVPLPVMIVSGLSEKRHVQRDSKEPTKISQTRGAALLLQNIVHDFDGFLDRCSMQVYFLAQPIRPGQGVQGLVSPTIDIHLSGTLTA